jgi:type VI protein secretion system component VasK
MQESWHLSKSVPITFILAIVGQTVALVWYVSTLDASVESNARDIVRNETRIESLEKTVQQQAVTLARIDANLEAIRNIVEQMATRVNND